MAVAQILSAKLNPQLEKKLEFDYDDNQIYRELVSLETCPTLPDSSAYEKQSKNILGDSPEDASGTSEPVLGKTQVWLVEDGGLYTE